MLYLQHILHGTLLLLLTRQRYLCPDLARGRQLMTRLIISLFYSGRGFHCRVGKRSSKLHSTRAQGHPWSRYILSEKVTSTTIPWGREKMPYHSARQMRVICPETTYSYLLLEMSPIRVQRKKEKEKERWSLDRVFYLLYITVTWCY